MSFNKHWYVILLLLMCFCFTANAQLQPWRHINTDAFGNANITCITEDRSGFMYFATHEGVGIYDGRRFNNIEVPDRINKGIDMFTHALKWGRGGLLWIGTRSHILNYNPVTSKVNVVFKPTKGNLGAMVLDTVNNRMYVLLSDGFTTFGVTDTALTDLHKVPVSDISKFIMTPAGGLFLLKNSCELVQVKDGVPVTVYTTAYIKDLAPLQSGDSLLMLTGNGLQLWDGHTQLVRTVGPRRTWDVSSGKTRLMPLADGRILVQHAEHITLLAGVVDTVGKYYVPDSRNLWSLKGNFVTTAYTDRRNNLWVAEDGVGVSVLPSRATSIHYLPGNMIGAARLWKLFHDSARQQVFASSENGLCAIYYAADSVSYRPNIKPNGSVLFDVMDYIPWSKDEVLLLTNKQGSWLFNTLTYKFQPFLPIEKLHDHKSIYGAKPWNDHSYLLYGPNGLVLLARNNNTVTEIYTRQKGIVGMASGNDLHTIFSACVDYRRQLWLGTGIGIFVLDSNFNLIKRLGSKNGNTNNGLGNSVIFDMKQSDDNNMYVATAGGLYKSARSDSFVHVPLAGNLAYIYCIEFLDKENLLLTSSKGMCMYNTRSRKSWLINESNGIPLSDFNQFALVNDKRFIMAAGPKGVILVEKKQLFANFRDSADMQVMIGSLALQELTLQKGKHTLDVDVAITGYASANLWNIQYRLEGLDDDWREMTKGEWHIHYNSLAPGSYTLQVRAVDEQHVVWVKNVDLPVVVLPFFWQTTWFRLLVFILAIGLLITIVRFFSQTKLKWQLKKMEDDQKVIRERLRISRELHDNVGSQLTSLITGLETTGLMIRRQQPEVLEQRLEHLHTSARESMHQLRDSIWALNSESVALSALLERFEAWLHNIVMPYPQIAVRVSNTVDMDFMLDPVKSLNLFRIMQESVHNVLKHANATCLDISITTTENRLNVKIEDNGKGFEKAGKAGNGLRFMNARAEEIAATFEINAAQNKGTCITLTLLLK